MPDGVSPPASLLVYTGFSGERRLRFRDGLSCTHFNRSKSTNVMSHLVSTSVLGLLLLLSLSTFAATRTVSNLNDTGTGSLRRTVTTANNGDEIVFGVSGTIVLTSGSISINKSIRIVGPGPTNLTVSGNSASRIFSITAGTVVLGGLTFKDGVADATQDGGAITATGGSLEITNCVFQENAASNGGALSSTRNTILSQCAFLGNVASNHGGALKLSSQASLNQCSVISNLAASAGGIYLLSPANVSLTNCTVSSNQGTNAGGGIRLANNTLLMLKNCTISGNSSGIGGGLHAGTGCTNLLINTVLAANSSPEAPDIYALSPIASLGNNFIGVGFGSTGLVHGVNSDQVGSVAQPLNPRLGGLHNRQFFRWYHPVLPESPLIDAGQGNTVSAFDHAGLPRLVDGDSNGAPTIDVGAVEFQTYLVTSGGDSGADTMRDAAQKLENAGSGRIHFSLTNRPAIVLSNTLTIGSPVFIDGASQPGYKNLPILELDGTHVTNGPGLRITGGHSVVRAMTLHCVVGGAGISFESGGSNVLRKCFVGTETNGIGLRENFFHGVLITNSSYNLIGGPSTTSRNVICANFGAGIAILGNESRGNLIQGNFIGLAADGDSARGNRNGPGGPGYGIQIDGGNETLIGGTNVFQANVIEWNQAAGVAIVSGTNNRVIGNDFKGNAGMGIDLLGDGPTENDPLDGDNGPNGLQNAPVLLSASSEGVIRGRLSSKPNSDYLIQLFNNSQCDPSGSGEGETYLLSFVVRTDATGLAEFTNNVPPDAQHPVLTATATDAAGNTSEFSFCAPNSAPQLFLPAQRSLYQGGQLPFLSSNAIRILDIDAGNRPLRLSLRANVGTLSFGDVGQLLFEEGDGTADQGITCRGSQAALNTALQTLIYQAPNDLAGLATIEVRINDLGNSGRGSSLEESGVIHANILARPLLSMLPSTGATLAFQAEPNTVAKIFFSTNLVLWEEIGIAQYLGDRKYSFTDPAGTSLPCGFYRIQLDPQ